MGAEPAFPASMRPTLRMARLFLLALGPGGTALAAVAAAVGIACSILVGITLNESLTASQFSQELNYQQRVLAFSRTDRQLMHAIEGLSSGYLVPRPGDFPVRERWRAFDRALADICEMLDPAIPNIDRLRQTCLERDSFLNNPAPALDSDARALEDRPVDFGLGNDWDSGSTDNGSVDLDGGGGGSDDGQLPAQCGHSHVWDFRPRGRCR